MARYYRLFFSHSLKYKGQICKIEGTSYHHYKTVLRIKQGQDMLVFNGCDGLWLATVQNMDAKYFMLCLQHQVKTQPTTLFPLQLYFSPIKEQATLMASATALGVTDFFPITCMHTKAQFKPDKMESVIIGAMEQCKRLDKPRIHPIRSVQTIDFSSYMYYTNMQENVQHMENAKMNQDYTRVLIGPEGGFSIQEHEYIMNHPCVIPLTLGDWTLRSELATVVALTILNVRRHA